MKTRNKAFTIVEIITVITIIAILVGLLLPAISKVKTMVKETQQKAQLNTIALGIMAFKNDFGYYPPSSRLDPQNVPYCGAQKLAEAMLGQDLLGFHSKSVFRRDGLSDTTPPVDLYPAILNPSVVLADKQNLEERKGPYLDEGNKYAFTLSQLKYKNNLGPLMPVASGGDNGQRYVLCDVFTVYSVAITDRTGKVTRYNAGTPILYYRANTTSKIFDNGSVRDRIYNCQDNLDLIRLGKVRSGKQHTLYTDDGQNGIQGLWFYDPRYKIVDPKTSTANMDWPYRPDSYLLISAGADGEYGTRDDITNFE
jgi:type II secretory pathway pseudopilin PulG